MLRITPVERADGVTLKSEGQLAGPWVQALEQACLRWQDLPGSLLLDLADVTFADAAGVALVHRLRESAVPISGCSPFLQEQLRLANPPSSGPP